VTAHCLLDAIEMQIISLLSKISVSLYTIAKKALFTSGVVDAWNSLPAAVVLSHNAV